MSGSATARAGIRFRKYPGRVLLAMVGAAATFAGTGITHAVASVGARQAESPITCTATPRLSSTFLPTYFAAAWNQSTWVSKLNQLKADCITNVIIQYTADATTETSYFPTGMAGWHEYAGDPVVADALSAADSVGGVTVTVGLSINDWWFDEHAAPAAMATQADTDNALADQLWAQYSGYQSFAGWYLPLEMDSTNFASAAAWQTMATYYSAVAGHLQSLTPALPVTVAPFFTASDAGAGGQTPAQWQTMWAYILARAPIDVLAVQDGVGDSDAVDGSLGAARVTAVQLGAWFSATAAAIAQARPATQLWDDVELYSPQDGRSMLTGEVVADMQAVTRWVSTFTSFSWFSQVDPAWTGTAGYQDAYQWYADTGEVPAESVSPPRGLRAAASDDHTVTLAWAPGAATDGIEGYYVSRAGTLIALLRGGTTGTFLDRDAPPGPVEYTLRAFDAAGNESPPATVAVRVPFESYHVDVAAGRLYVASMPTNAPYTDRGSKLTDGVVAGPSYNDPAWQGRISSTPYSFVIDLGSVRTVDQMSVEALADGAVGIYLPATVTYATSTDGTEFRVFAQAVPRPAVPVGPSIGRYTVTSSEPVNARWVKVTVTPTSLDDWTFVADLTVDSFRAQVNGYWAVSRTGKVMALGAAPDAGGMSALHLARPVVTMAATPDGGGYWLVASDGGIFSFGDARFYGSTGGVRLTEPVVGMAATPDGGGYWLVASDGGMFAFGDAKFWGSAAGQLGASVTAMATSTSSL